MNIEIGIKSDPVQYRYSYQWLFDLMRRLNISNLQLGSFFEMYRLPDRYFMRLREQAADNGVRIRSCFTAHRELGGFLMDDPDFHAVALESYSRFLEIGSLLGADSVGSNPGAVLRDRMETKKQGIRRYLSAMEELSRRASRLGLKALTVEPMSSLAEPPSTPTEITNFMEHFAILHRSLPQETVPVYLCGDVSHGLADHSGRVVHGNLELFKLGIPWMWEFHLKNTNVMFSSTFGFGSEERGQGIVDLEAVRVLVDANRDRFPTETVVAYLEINGPKLGRDYTDRLLEQQLTQSIAAIKESFCKDEPARAGR